MDPTPGSPAKEPADGELTQAAVATWKESARAAAQPVPAAVDPAATYNALDHAMEVLRGCVAPYSGEQAQKVAKVFRQFHDQVGRLVEDNAKEARQWAADLARAAAPPQPAPVATDADGLRCCDKPDLRWILRCEHCWIVDTNAKPTAPPQPSSGNQRALEEMRSLRDAIPMALGLPTWSGRVIKSEIDRRIAALQAAAVEEWNTVEPAAPVPQPQKPEATRERDEISAPAEAAPAPAPAPVGGEGAVDALGEVAAEREKQRRKWGYGHDDEHDDKSLVKAALSLVNEYLGVATTMHPWQLPQKHKEPRDRLRIAAALIVAEMERLSRSELARRAEKGAL